VTRLVVDASAVVAAFAETTTTSTTLRRRLFAGECHAPRLLDAEVGSVARRMVLAGRLPPVLGFELIASVAAVVDQWHAHGPLARLAWSLRSSVSYYDALYVSVATALDLPLVTADARLARAPGLTCAVELLNSAG
jgi:predicted nucleic acid-binding protein